jgi:hypothetical protein
MSLTSFAPYNSSSRIFAAWPVEAMIIRANGGATA